MIRILTNYARMRLVVASATASGLTNVNAKHAIVDEAQSINQFFVGRERHQIFIAD